MSNPLDDYFLHKEAAGFWTGFFGHSEALGHDLRSAAIGAGVSLAAAAAVPAAQKLYGAISKRHEFNNMMQHNPQLQSYQKADGPRFNQTYSSLRRLNPAFGKDPLVAGGLMTRMMDEPEATSNILMEISKAYRTPQMGPMQQAVLSGAQKPGFIKPDY